MGELLAFSEESFRADARCGSDQYGVPKDGTALHGRFLLPAAQTRAARFFGTEW